MFQVRLLGLVMRYPQPAALTRKVCAGSLFEALTQLEDRGLVTRRRGLYRLTRRGRRELSMTRAMVQLLARSHR
jgi:DNA-binding PadR family transcriptional regulator